MTNTDKKMGCLAGKILRVDLESGKLWTESTYPYAEKALGGRGINSLIMVNEMAAGTKWTDPENLLCFGAGTMVGTMVPGSCRVDVSSINVFSGGKGAANVGGFWGPELKYAGYDNVIIKGKSDKPVYLYINDDQVELRDAADFWGMSTSESEEAFREKLGDRDIKIAQIGPAGESLVRGSAVMIDGNRAAGGSGVGCIMGDKKLKAIVVRGHGKIEVADPERFMEEVAKCYQQCAAEPNAVPMRKSLTNFYSEPDFEGWDGIMSIRNGQDDSWPKEKRIELMNRKTGIPRFRQGMRACYTCPTGCSLYAEINDGKYKGTKGEGFWVNTIMGHACRLDNSDPDSVMKSWNYGNELGLDGDYVASGLAWVFELYEKGIITKEDTDGLDLTWGNGDAVIELMRKMVERDGFGDLLADGMVEAAQKIAQNSEYYLVHMKGQPSIEPFRIPKGWGLAVAQSPVAGRHLRGSSIGSKRFGPRPRPSDFNINDYKNQAKNVYWQGRTKEMEDSLGICNYNGTWSGANFMTPANFAVFIEAGMGIKADEARIMDEFGPVGRNLEKAFNTLMTDLDRKDDMPPKRYQENPTKSGPYKGSIADPEEYNKMLDELYTFYGWDVKTGLQTRESLKSLGLDHVADKLKEAGKLIGE